jgi:hypothetical protein
MRKTEPGTVETGITRMNAESQRIAIAEACGWTCCGNVPGSIPHGLAPYRNVSQFSTDEILVGSVPIETLPDYLNDLNAIHEAETILDGGSVDERSLWLDYLAIACNCPKTQNAAELRFETNYLVARATAAQRAEAFLRAIGKWGDSK